MYVKMALRGYFSNWKKSTISTVPSQYHLNDTKYVIYDIDQYK